MSEELLPEKLSDCLDLALRDLEKCEQSSLYTIHMGIWHDNVIRSKCYVCLAGSVMAQTLGAKLEEKLCPISYSEYNELRLSAIDYLRQGRINRALRAITYTCPDKLLKDIIVSTYDMNSEQFKLDMKSIAGLLREEGL